MDNGFSLADHIRQQEIENLTHEMNHGNFALKNVPKTLKFDFLTYVSKESYFHENNFLILLKNKEQLDDLLAGLSSEHIINLLSAGADQFSSQKSVLYSLIEKDLINESMLTILSNHLELNDLIKIDDLDAILNFYIEKDQIKEFGIIFCKLTIEHKGFLFSKLIMDDYYTPGRKEKILKYLVEILTPEDRRKILLEQRDLKKTLIDLFVENNLKMLELMLSNFTSNQIYTLFNSSLSWYGDEVKLMFALIVETAPLQNDQQYWNTVNHFVLKDLSSENRVKLLCDFYRGIRYFLENYFILFQYVSNQEMMEILNAPYNTNETMLAQFIKDASSNENKVVEIIELIEKLNPPARIQLCSLKTDGSESALKNAVTKSQLNLVAALLQGIEFKDIIQLFIDNKIDLTTFDEAFVAQLQNNFNAEELIYAYLKCGRSAAVFQRIITILQTLPSADFKQLMSGDISLTLSNTEVRFPLISLLTAYGACKNPAIISLLGQASLNPTIILDIEFLNAVVGLTENNKSITGFMAAFENQTILPANYPVDTRKQLLLTPNRSLLHALLKNTFFDQRELIPLINQWLDGFTPAEKVQALTPEHLPPNQIHPLLQYTQGRHYDELTNFLIGLEIPIEAEHFVQVAANMQDNQGIHKKTLEFTIGESLKALDREMPLSPAQIDAAISSLKLFTVKFSKRIEALKLEISTLQDDNPKKSDTLQEIRSLEVACRALDRILTPAYLNYPEQYSGLSMSHVLTYIFHYIGPSLSKTSSTQDEVDEEAVKEFIRRLNDVQRGYNVDDTESDRPICTKGTLNNFILPLQNFYPNQVWIIAEDEKTLSLKVINKMHELINEILSDPTSAQEEIKLYKAKPLYKIIHLSLFEKLKPALKTYLYSILTNDNFDPPRLSTETKAKVDELIDVTFSLVNGHIAQAPKELLQQAENKIKKVFQLKAAELSGKDPEIVRKNQNDFNQLPAQLSPNENTQGGLYHGQAGHIEAPEIPAATVKPLLFCYDLSRESPCTPALAATYESLPVFRRFAVKVELPELPQEFIAMTNDTALMQGIIDLFKRKQPGSPVYLLMTFQEHESSQTWMNSPTYAETLQKLGIPPQIIITDTSGISEEEDKEQNEKDEYLQEHSLTMYGALFKIQMDSLKHEIEQPLRAHSNFTI